MNSDLDLVDVFPWNSNFDTGIDVIDEQHKVLVRLLNQLASTLASDNQDEIFRVFDELVEYANYHFDTEENLWREVFPDSDDWLELHQQAHRSFIPAVQAMKQRDLQSSLDVAVEDVIKFLIHWLAFHIIDEDMRMALAVNEYQKGCSIFEAKQSAERQMAGSVEVLVNTLLSMYDNLSSRTLDLMRERVQRQKVEAQLRQLNDELEKLSITDSLTGLYNRRHFDELLHHELRRCVRTSSNMNMLLLDIDYFKKLNDHYGHLQGDEALKQVAECLNGLCRRPGDYCFRIGGEEFCVVIEESSAEQARQFAENMRREIEALLIPHKASLVSDYLTVSVGVVSKVARQEDSIDTFLKHADESLYSAKERGRNRVECYQG